MARPTANAASEEVDPRAPGRLAGARIGCLVSTYHHELVGSMAASARDHLLRGGLPAEAWLQLDVPGAFELPLAAQTLAERSDIDAVLAFGLILKGETEHDRHIAGAVAQGLMQIGLATRKPVLFGVLTCNTLEQAQARARRVDEGGLDKGLEVAKAALAQLLTLESAAGRPVEGGGAR